MQAILLRVPIFPHRLMRKNWLKIDFKAQFEEVWKLVEAGIGGKN